MKMICLTKCAKAQIYDTIGVILAIASIFLGIAVFIGIGLPLIGLITQGIYVGITGSLIGIMMPLAKLGLLTIAVMLIIVILSYALYNFIEWLYTMSIKTYRNVIGVEKFQCSIFEVCEVKLPFWKKKDKI